MPEIKPIEGYENYFVSSDGKIYCNSRRWRGGGTHDEPSMHQLKATVKENGYCSVLLRGNIDKRFYVHRLVAQAFIPNPENLPQINHKDEDKQNNDVSNLEWCTARYNLAYGSRHQREMETQGHPVLQFSLDGKLVNRFFSASEATRQTNISRINILDCCYGKANVAGGYIWAFEDDVFDSIINKNIGINRRHGDPESWKKAAAK